MFKHGGASRAALVVALHSSCPAAGADMVPAYPKAFGVLGAGLAQAGEEEGSHGHSGVGRSLLCTSCLFREIEKQI